MKKITPILLLALAAATSLPTYATPISVTIDLDTVFTGSAPSGSAPWLSATFISDTTSKTGTLTLTSKLTSGDFLQGGASGTIGWAFFLNTGIKNIGCKAGTAGGNCADTVNGTFNAGPLGKSWNLAFGWLSGDRFDAGDTAVYDITFDSFLTGSPFGTNTDKKVGGWLSVAHVQGIGKKGCSGWIVAGAGKGAQGPTEQCGGGDPVSSVPVPEPSVLGMFGLGALMVGLFAGLRRRLHVGPRLGLHQDRNSGSF